MSRSRHKHGEQVRRLERLLADHRAAANELLAAAGTFPDAQWHRPLRDGAWTPAQHVLHVSLAYEAAIHDIRDDRPARLIGRAWQRRMWRWFSFPQIFWLRRLPRGARAPREMRPPADARPDRMHLGAELLSNVEELERVVRDAVRATPHRALAHPYFGAVTLEQALRISAVHARHHARALLTPPVPPAVP